MVVSFSDLIRGAFEQKLLEINRVAHNEYISHPERVKRIKELIKEMIEELAHPDPPREASEEWTGPQWPNHGKDML